MKQGLDRSRLGRISGITALIVAAAIGCRESIPSRFEESSRLPNVYPDYTETTIPPNVAPTNFVVEENGDRFLTKISAVDSKRTILVAGKTVEIPFADWKKLLDENAGKEIRFDVFARNQGKWTKYQTFVQKVADSPIDSWVSYRLIAPGYEHYSNLGLYQRNLETFDEKPFFRARLIDEKTCVNCHSFQNRKTDNFLFHTRQTLGGTVVVRDGKAEKINTKIPETGGSCVYPAWHPTEPLVAFSVNNTVQIFHSYSLNKIEVLDTHSDLVLFDADQKTISPILPKSDLSFETFPSWSPDGKSLYYCQANLDLKVSRDDLDERKNAALENYSRFKYNLMRIPFDPATRRFGDPETVVDAAAIDKSVVHPRVSPDGKSILYTLSQYGTFPIWHRDSDLWLLDLETGASRPLTEVNSDEAESFHNWDSSGNWFVFSSRRDDGSFTRLYFSHKNADGSFSKPFLLPQKNPNQNVVLMKSYNIPELTTEPIDVHIAELAKAARVVEPPSATFLPATPKSTQPK